MYVQITGKHFSWKLISRRFFASHVLMDMMFKVSFYFSILVLLCESDDTISTLLKSIKQNLETTQDDLKHVIDIFEGDDMNNDFENDILRTSTKYKEESYDVSPK